MTKCTVGLLLVAVLALGALVHGGGFAAAQTGGAAQPGEPTGNAEKGKQLYSKFGCYQCHGLQGQGSSATGPRLGPSPISFAAFAEYCRTPKGEMPPYTAKVVSDQDLADMHAFLKSLPRPAPVDSIPLLK